MPLNGHVATVPSGVRGFDANQTITRSIAAAFHQHGYRFCVRYVRRGTPKSFDLTASEAEGLLSAGLALSVVQHVAREGWVPTAALGLQYGSIAASETQRIGVPSGIVLWCDLEGVLPGTDAGAVRDYCNNWHSAVAAAGYVPGLYVGSGAGLGPAQLYALRFTHYWGAYNLNTDERPAVRGLQMQQSVVKTADRVSGYNFEFQVDTVAADRLNGLPAMLTADDWLATL